MTKAIRALSTIQCFLFSSDLDWSLVSALLLRRPPLRHSREGRSWEGGTEQGSELVCPVRSFEVRAAVGSGGGGIEKP